MTLEDDVDDFDDDDFDDDDFDDDDFDDTLELEGEDLCWLCQGDGFGLLGHDWENDDPVNCADGSVEECPCCGGSGLAKDCTYW